LRRLKPINPKFDTHRHGNPLFRPEKWFRPVFFKSLG